MNTNRQRREMLVASVSLILTFSVLPGSFAQEVTETRLRDQYEALSHIADSTEKVFNAYAQIQDESTRALEVFEALAADTPIKEAKSKAGAFVFEPHVTAMEELVQRTPAIIIEPLPPFPANAASANAHGKRKILRSAVLDFSGGKGQFEVATITIKQYRELQKAIGNTESLFMGLGDKLVPLIGLASAPIPLGAKRQFISDVGFLPIDLLENYPRRLRQASEKLNKKMALGREAIKTAKAVFMERRTLLIEALNAERLKLNEAHEKFLRRQREVDRLGTMADDLNAQLLLAIDARDRASVDVNAAETSFMNANARRTSAERERSRAIEAGHSALVATKKAYSCSVGTAWEPCEHHDQKAYWLRASLDLTAVHYRNQIEAVKSAEQAIRDTQEAWVQAKNNRASAAKALKEAATTRDAYLEAFKKANLIYSQASEELIQEKYASQIDLLWNANDRDKTFVASVIF